MWRWGRTGFLGTLLIFYSLKPAWKDLKTSGQECSSLYTTLFALMEDCSRFWRAADLPSGNCSDEWGVHKCIYKKIKGDSTLLAVLHKDVLQQDKGWNLLSCRWFAPVTLYHLWTPPSPPETSGWSRGGTSAVAEFLLCKSCCFHRGCGVAAKWEKSWNIVFLLGYCSKCGGWGSRQLSCEQPLLLVRVHDSSHWPPQAMTRRQLWLQNILNLWWGQPLPLFFATLLQQKYPAQAIMLCTSGKEPRVHRHNSW